MMKRDTSPQARANREAAIAVALRHETADSIVRDCSVLDVHTGTFFSAGIAIAGERIAFVGDVNDLIGPKTRILDAGGRIAIPGLMMVISILMRLICRSAKQHGVYFRMELQP
jgi:adenine deaminase